MYVGTLFVGAEWLLWLETLFWSFCGDKPLSCGWMDEHGHRQCCQRGAHCFETAKVNVCGMLFSSLRACQPKSASPTGHFYHLPELPTGDKLLSSFLNFISLESNRAGVSQNLQWIAQGQKMFCFFPSHPSAQKRNKAKKKNRGRTVHRQEGKPTNSHCSYSCFRQKRCRIIFSAFSTYSYYLSICNIGRSVCAGRARLL